jgi:hypothetical protein
MFTGRKKMDAATLAQHGVTVAGVKDAIFNPLYDYQTYAAAGQQQLTFFALPQGQGVTSHPGGAGVKTLADTNMQAAGALPAGNWFYCMGIEIEFWAGSTTGANGAVAAALLAQQWGDVYAFMRSGWLNFRIQNRDYATDAPMAKFPSQTHMVANAANSDTTTAGAGQYTQLSYAGLGGAAYNIIPVYITPTQAFSVTLNWPNVIALPSTVAARVGVRLVGNLIRSAQ